MTTTSLAYRLVGRDGEVVLTTSPEEMVQLRASGYRLLSSSQTSIGAASGVERVSGVYPLGEAETGTIRELYCVDAATIEGEVFSAGTTLVCLRTATGWSRKIVDGWTAFKAGSTQPGGGSGSDTTPPSAVTAVTVSAITTTSASLSWSAATDAQSEVSYGWRVYKTGSTPPEYQTTTETSVVVDGLTGGTAYTAQAYSFSAGGAQTSAAASKAFTTDVVRGWSVADSIDFAGVADGTNVATLTTAVRHVAITAGAGYDNVPIKVTGGLAYGNPTAGGPGGITIPVVAGVDRWRVTVWYDLTKVDGHQGYMARLTPPRAKWLTGDLTTVSGDSSAQLTPAGQNNTNPKPTVTFTSGKSDATTYPRTGKITIETDNTTKKTTWSIDDAKIKTVDSSASLYQGESPSLATEESIMVGMQEGAGVAKVVYEVYQ